MAESTEETLKYTVTYLEMEAMPGRPLRPVPAGASLALMRVETPPVHYFRYLYGTVGAEYEWSDAFQLSPEALEVFVTDPKVEMFVLYRGGAPAGFYQLDFRVRGVCDLAYFGLMPEAVGQGIGPWLLDTAIGSAWSPQRDDAISKMTVNTCTLDHPSALAMYQRAGFVPVRRAERTRTASG
ncbi:MAG: GNAT family N-acetyltransferase [Pseudomonadota bacterium]